MNNFTFASLSGASAQHFKTAINFMIALLTTFTCLGQDDRSISTYVENSTEFKTHFAEAYVLNPEIPNGLLEAISYTTTRVKHRVPDVAHQNCSGTPHIYGVMGLVSEQQPFFQFTIADVADASGYSVSQLKASPRYNILGFAKWMAIQYRNTNDIEPNLKDFLPIVMKSTGIVDDSDVSSFLRNDYALQIVKRMIEGVRLENTIYTQPKTSLLVEEYFESRFLDLYKENRISLPIEDNSTNRSSNSSDYAPATWVGSTCFSSRGGSSITDVVIHDMEGYFTYTVYTHFQNCGNQASSHYAIRSNDGFVVQLISESDKAWHVGNGNPYSIGIEHEGFANDPSWYTESMYQSSADLVINITQSGYGIDPASCYVGPSNTNGTIDPQPVNTRIKGHCHYPLSINSNSHYDPGQNWDWNYYYGLINGASNDDGPDLVIEEMWIVPANPEPGENVDLYVRVKNVGEVVANGSSLDYRINGNIEGVDSFASLESGEEVVEFRNNYIFTSSGLNDYCVYIDAVSGEQNTLNNSFCIDVNVDNGGSSSHDFYIANLTTDSSNYNLGDDIDIDLDHYTNNPSGEAVSVELQYTLRDSNGNVLEVLGDDTSSLGAGDEYDGESILATPTSSSLPTNCQVCAEANYDGAIPESDTSNNLSCVDINIQTLSVEDVNLENTIKLFPNPTTAVINIDLGNNSIELSKVILYNTFGAKVYQSDINFHEIDISNFQAGTYFLKVFDDLHRTATFKVIKK